jgi:hypothetical protein
MPFHLLSILINGRRRPRPWGPERMPGKFPERALNPSQLIITLNLRIADIQINERICLRKFQGSLTLIKNTIPFVILMWVDGSYAPSP